MSPGEGRPPAQRLGLWHSAVLAPLMAVEIRNASGVAAEGAANVHVRAERDESLDRRASSGERSALLAEMRWLPDGRPITHAAAASQTRNMRKNERPPLSGSAPPEDLESHPGRVRSSHDATSIAFPVHAPTTVAASTTRPNPKAIVSSANSWRRRSISPVASRTTNAR